MLSQFGLKYLPLAVTGVFILPGLLCADIVADPDGLAMSAADRPNLGRLVYANANSVFDAFFEDLYGLGDGDYNDSAWRMRFDSSGQLASTEYLFGASAFTHRLIVGPVSRGQAIRVGIEVSVPDAPWVRQRDKMQFWTGDGLENEDLMPHAVVVCREGCFPVETPEPGQWAVLAAGLAGLGYVIRRKRSPVAINP